MQKSKLLESLRCLSGRKLSRFGEFLASPYFNKTSSNLQFFEFLLNYAPAFDHPDLDRQSVLRNWSLPGEGGEPNLHYRLNALTGLLETFLAVEELLSDDFSLHLNTFRQASRHEMDLFRQTARRRLTRDLADDPWRNNHYYEKAYRLAFLDYQHHDHPPRTFNPRLQAAADALDLFYFTTKMRYSWSMTTQERLLNVSYQHHLEKALLQLLDDHPGAPEVAVRVYRCALDMLADFDNTDPYYQLKALLSEEGHKFPPGERMELYTGLLNFCTRQINHFADEHFREEYLDINITLLDEGLLLHRGELSPWRYTNLVAAALQCNRAVWARSFLEEGRQQLPPSYADNIYQYNLGYFHYQTGDLDQARRVLARVAFEDVVFNVLLRSLLTRVYYEAGEEELLFSYLEANRLFLLRNDLIEERLRIQVQNFLDFTRRLARIGKPEAKELPALQADLPIAREIMHREWLLRQIRNRMRALGVDGA